MASGDPDDLASLMMQLENVAGAAQTAPPPPPLAAADEDDSDDDDLAGLQRQPQTADARRAAAHAAMQQAVLQCSRLHDLFLSPAALAEKRQKDAEREQRAADGKPEEDDAADDEEFDLNVVMVRSHQRTLRAEAAAAAKADAELTLHPASHAAVNALAKINKDRYHSDAWKALLHDIAGLPLARTRHLWRCFMALYPRQAHYAHLYVQKEIQHEVAQRDGDALGVDDAVLARLRILDLFAAHLPLCITSARLYDLFLNYAQDTVHLDGVTLDEKCGQAVDRVGRCIDAAPVWRFYIAFYGTFRRRSPDVVQWTRATYHQWLSLPVEGHDQAQQEYSDFEMSLRGHQRIRLEAKLDERFKRAKSLHAAKAELWEALDPTFLPSPGMMQLGEEHAPVDLGTDAASGAAARSMMRAAVAFDDEVEDAYDVVFRQQNAAAHAVAMWRAWAAILADELSAQRSGLSVTAHAHRFAFILRQRLCYFPHMPLCWLDLARHYSAAAMTAVARSVFEEAMQRFPCHLLVHFSAAEALSSVVNVKDAAQQRANVAGGNQVMLRLVRGLVAAVNGIVKDCKAKGPTAELSVAEVAAMTDLKNDLSTACCTWLHWSKHALRDNGVLHMRAVARHCLKSLGMGRNPAFLSEWVSLELRLNGDVAVARGIVDGWVKVGLKSLEKLRALMVGLLDEADAAQGKLFATARAGARPLEALHAAMEVAVDVCRRVVLACQARCAVSPDVHGRGAPATSALLTVAVAQQHAAAADAQRSADSGDGARPDYASIAVACAVDATLIATLEQLATFAPADSPHALDAVGRLRRAVAAFSDTLVAWCSRTLRAVAPDAVRAVFTREADAGANASGGASLGAWCRLQLLPPGTAQSTAPTLATSACGGGGIAFAGLVRDGLMLNAAVDRIAAISTGTLQTPAATDAVAGGSRVPLSISKSPFFAHLAADNFAGIGKVGSFADAYRAMCGQESSAASNYVRLHRSNAAAGVLPVQPATAALLFSPAATQCIAQRGHAALASGGNGIAGDAETAASGRRENVVPHASLDAVWEGTSVAAQLDRAPDLQRWPRVATLPVNLHDPTTRNAAATHLDAMRKRQRTEMGRGTGFDALGNTRGRGGGRGRGRGGADHYHNQVDPDALLDQLLATQELELPLDPMGAIPDVAPTDGDEAAKKMSTPLYRAAAATPGRLQHLAAEAVVAQGLTLADDAAGGGAADGGGAEASRGDELRRLLLALPTPHGCIERFEPFMTAAGRKEAGAGASERDGDSDDEDDDDKQRVEADVAAGVPTTRYVLDLLRVLA
jgi:hypothetical protein